MTRHALRLTAAPAGIRASRPLIQCAGADAFYNACHSGTTPHHALARAATQGSKSGASWGQAVGGYLTLVPDPEWHRLPIAPGPTRHWYPPWRLAAPTLRVRHHSPRPQPASSPARCTLGPGPKSSRVLSRIEPSHFQRAACLAQRPTGRSREPRGWILIDLIHRYSPRAGIPVRAIFALTAAAVVIEPRGGFV